MTKGTKDERDLLGEYALALAAVGEAPPSKRGEALGKLGLNTNGFLGLSKEANAVMDRAIDNRDDSAIQAFATAFEATRARLRAENAAADEPPTIVSVPAPQRSPALKPGPAAPAPPAVLPMPEPRAFLPPELPRPAPPPMINLDAFRNMPVTRGTKRMENAPGAPPTPPAAATPPAPPSAPALTPPALTPPALTPPAPPAPLSPRSAPSSAPFTSAASARSAPAPAPSAAFVGRGGDTVMRPGLEDDDGLPSPAHFREPRLALMQYAALRAEILGAPEGMRGAVYARYRLSEAEDAAEAAAWNARFSADRPLFAQYMQLFSYFRSLGKR